MSSPASGDPQAAFEAMKLATQANFHRDSGNFPEAERHYRKALEFAEKAPEPREAGLANCRFGLAYSLLRQSQFEEAAVLFAQVLPAAMKRGPMEFRTNALRYYAQTQQERGDFDSASSLYTQWIEIVQNTFGSTHADVAEAVATFAEAQLEVRHYDDAERLFLQALAIEYQLNSPETGGIALLLYKLALVYRGQERTSLAESVFRQAADITQKCLEAQKPVDGRTLTAIARTYSDHARNEEAEQVLLHAIRSDEMTHGAQHRSVGEDLIGLALVRRNKGDLEGAEQAMTRAFAFLPKTDLALLTQAHNVLGGIRMMQGRMAEAQSELERALTLAAEAFGPFHPVTADILASLADVCRYRSRFVAAARHLRTAQEIAEHSGDPALLSKIFNNFGTLFDEQGAFEEAESYFRRALNSAEAVHGPNHPEVAMALMNYAGASLRLRKFEQAVALCERAAAICDQHSDVDPGLPANIQNELGTIYLMRGDFVRGEEHCRNALRIAERLFSEHPVVAMSLHNAGSAVVLRNLSGDAEPNIAEMREAESMLLRSLRIVTASADSSEHMNHSTLLAHIALAKMTTGEPEEVARWLFASTESAWDQLTANFSTMSRQSKANFEGHLFFRDNGDALYSFAFLSRNLSGETAFRYALLSKQLMFEAERQERGVLRSLAQQASAEFEFLSRKQEELRQEYRRVAIAALLDTSDREAAATAARLHKEIESLGERMRSVDPAFADRARVRRVEPDDVRQVLGPTSALVEFIRYSPGDESLYGAFVVRSAGDVAAVPLGNAEQIENTIVRLRKHMNSAVAAFESGTAPDGMEDLFCTLSENLRALVWDPLKEALTGVDRVYLAPDGMLSLFPFEALSVPDEAGGRKYLGEWVEFVYVNTGRDLARFAVRDSTRTPEAVSRTAVLISAPDFNAAPEQIAAGLANEPAAAGPLAEVEEQTASLTMGRRSGITSRRWKPLEETRKIDEVAGDLLRRSGWNVLTWTGVEASKERVLALPAHTAILQISTHGDVAPPASAAHDNPLLRSVLLFAGCNRNAGPHPEPLYRVDGAVFTQSEAVARGLSTSEFEQHRIQIGDGVLTAWEVTGMDLRRTQLVNLAACNTGLGDVTPDGVVGLRQGFLLAGARALTMSMWQVPTTNTVRQFVDFYNFWLNAPGGGSIPAYIAFRQSQLEALRIAREAGHGHPFFWAGIVFSGDPGDLGS